jgi:RNA polymerase sigma-70 factor, ECF subfamily
MPSPFLLERLRAPDRGREVTLTAVRPAPALEGLSERETATNSHGHWRGTHSRLRYAAVSSPEHAPAGPQAPGAHPAARQGGLGGPAGPNPSGTVEISDASLVARMVEGDRGAIATLYERHVACLLALAQTLLRDRREAEDLIHDVFLEAWRHCADYSADRGTVRTWLSIRTRSRALDRLKAARPRQTESADLERIEGVRSASEAEGHAMLGDQHRLRQTLSQMPEAQQEVILLGYFEGLSTTEMASRLGIPAGTVKSRTRAALSTLRSLLSGRDD